MNGDIIKVDKAQIKEVVNTLNNKVVELEGQIQSIKGSLDNVSDAWKGVDATKYVNKLSIDYVNELISLKECIESFSNYLNNVPDKYTDLDKESASAFGSIEV